MGKGAEVSRKRKGRKHEVDMAPGWMRRARAGTSFDRGGCSRFPGKVRFVDEGVARAATQTGRETSSPLRYYACRHCDGYHLTSKGRP